MGFAAERQSVAEVGWNYGGDFVNFSRSAKAHSAKPSRDGCSLRSAAEPVDADAIYKKLVMCITRSLSVSRT